MTFEVGKIYTVQELADIAKAQLTKIGELEQKLALREAFIAGLQFNKTLYPEFEVKDDGNVMCQDGGCDD